MHHFQPNLRETSAVHAGSKSKRELVQIASRAIALYLVFWSLGNLGNVPAILFAISHYAAQPASPAQDYLNRYYLIQMSSQLVVSGGLFIAAVWTYRCGQIIERFLSPSEN